MRVVVLNYPGAYVEVSDVPMDIAERLENNSITDEDAMVEMGYDLDNIHWMFSTDDDDIPVFWKNEAIPYISL